MNLRKAVIFICFLVLVGIFLWSTLGREVRYISQEQPDTGFEYETLFTTGLSKNDRPVDRIEKISMEQERIYFYITWRNLSNKEYKLKTMIYDGSGKHVFSHPHKFKPVADGIFNTWCWYNFNKVADAPGYWRFEAYLDGEKVLEEQLRVVAGE